MQQRTISRYVLLEQVGSTGLATVYRAQGPNEEREVALKVLRSYVCTDEALLDRFSQNMLQVARLNHPNVLPVYGKENEGNVHWITMQYASLPTLRQWLQQPIPATQTIIILRQVAEALEAAQREGIYHGDIKPGNIFLDPETGHVLLSDFGIALLAEGSPPGIREALNTPLPTYSAPEQGQDSSSSALADIYSLGVLAYDMLTGTVPFNALERASVQARQLTSVPLFPSQVNPNIPEQLDAIILKALAPHPGRRYESAGEFVGALADASPLPEFTSLPFPVLKGEEAQGTLPGLEAVETALLIDSGPDVVCTVCGHRNFAGAHWCAECWGVLNRVAAAPGTKVLLTNERQQLQRRRTRIRMGILGSTAMAVMAILAVQFLNITLPLPTPSSTISSESNPGDWAMIHRTFEGSGQVPGESANITGLVKWTFETSAPLVSVPAVKDGTVYLTTHDNRVVSLDAFTGDVIWEYETVAPVDSSPAVAGDLVFLGVRNRRVIALDAHTGNIEWEFVTKSNPTIGSPIVKDGVVYIGSGDGNIYALDAVTGKKRWAHLTQDWITNTPALSGNLLAVSSLDTQVTIYDTDTGKKRFSFRGFGQPIQASPIIVEDSIYVSGRNGLLTSVNLKEKEVLFESRVYRAKTQLWWWGMIGNPGLPKGVNWGTQLGATISETPAAYDDKVYVPTEDGKLHAIDRFTGDILWTYNAGINLDARVAEIRSQVKAGDLTQADAARELAAVRADTLSYSTPTVVDDVLLMGDNNGMLHAIDLDNGEEQWALQITENAFSTPVLAGGILYLASEDGTLYAVE